jgi:hypothetical protein
VTTYAQVIPNRFDTAAAGAVSETKAASGASVRTVRRPTRGITLKEDTFATLRLVAGSGSNRKLIDAGGRRMEVDSSGTAKYMEIGNRRATDVYSNFLLQAINEDRSEKFQILETFGEPYIFLFGQRARMMSFQGVLINTWDFNWEAEWWENYDLYLRGTKCVEQDSQVYLSFDNTVVGGYIVQASATKDAVNRNLVNFQFQMFVTTYSNYSSVGDPTALPVSERDAADGNMAPMDVTRKITAAELAQYRPELINPFNTPDRAIVDPVTGELTYVINPLTGKTVKTLADALQDLSPSRIVKAWQSVADITNSAISDASGILNGTVMRVPYGFAGSMVYDEADQAAVARAVEVGGTVTYTTFSDNDDEYVGSSDHYGTSNIRWEGMSQSESDQTTDAVNSTLRAAQIWNDFGYDPASTAAQQELARVLSAAKLGLTLVTGVGAVVGGLAGGMTGTKDLSATSAVTRLPLPAPPR